jgi:hypothetical protein
MKLIISQYLASLKERNELDAILPDLLSQLGLNIISRPRQGTRQDGVDVAAVGSLNGGSEKVYLFSIKSGDLTRVTWDGDSIQSLRPSINEILDSYIPNRIPKEHKNKEIVICLCFGGEIQEQVRNSVQGFIESNKRENITFEEWNGDKLASHILSEFLQEDLLPEDARPLLRKSLALLNEPESSYQNFSQLIKRFSSTNFTKDKDRLKAIRQINICLWILFAWSRDAGNIESAYLASEISLLHGWEIAKYHFIKKTKTAEEIQMALFSILHVHLQITTEFTNKNIIPHSIKKYALSVAVQSSCALDVNLKLFDVLGRLAMCGIWALWNKFTVDNSEVIDELNRYIQSISNAIKQLIPNNPSLLLPIKDSQAIDISIALWFLSVDDNNHEFTYEWLSEIVDRASFSHQIQSQYPCNLNDYSELLEHPQRNNNAYHTDVTGGSILFPMIALWSAMFDCKDLYVKVQTIKEVHLKHCSFQFWYPDESSEEHFYLNSNLHGGTLSHLCINSSMSEFLKEAFDECDHSPQFSSLSATKNGLFPITLIACRIYRLPIPLHLFKGIYDENQKRLANSN